MAHRFDIILNGKLCTYTRYEDVPEVFEYLVAFVPEIPPGPHSHSEHEEINSWKFKFERLLERATCVQQPD